MKINSMGWFLVSHVSEQGRDPGPSIPARPQGWTLIKAVVFGALMRSGFYSLRAPCLRREQEGHRNSLISASTPRKTRGVEGLQSSKKWQTENQS